MTDSNRRQIRRLHAVALAAWHHPILLLCVFGGTLAVGCSSSNSQTTGAEASGGINGTGGAAATGGKGGASAAGASASGAVGAFGTTSSVAATSAASGTTAGVGGAAVGVGGTNAGVGGTTTGAGGTINAGGTTTGHASSTGGVTSAGGNSSVGGTSPAGGTGGGTSGVGGTKPVGGTGNSGGTGGIGGFTGASGGSTAAMGGNTATGGATSAGGATGGNTIAAGGTIASGGTSATGGAIPTGGATPTGGTTSTSALDCMDQPLAKPGDKVTQSGKYLNLGDMRLIDNKWGSDALNCGSTAMSVFVNSDKTLGWDFNRPDCDTAATNADPDYPEIEFGVAPFGSATDGNGKPLLTTPSCSSTTLLPKQIKDITSASVQLTNYVITLQNPDCGETTVGTVTTSNCSWNLNFEFWLSQDNPLTNPNPVVYAEVIGFFGWEKNRWACNKTGNVTSSGTSYNLCHQSDTWHTGSPHWRYWQFNAGSSPQTSFNGTVDIKAFIDWIVSNYSVSRHLWLTRIEVGTEIDDLTQGSVKLDNVAFQVNGTTKSPEFGE